MRVLSILVMCLVSAPAWPRVVVDMGGRSVEVPDRVERVGCLEILCYPRMFMPGAGDRIALTAKLLSGRGPDGSRFNPMNN